MAGINGQSVAIGEARSDIRGVVSNDRDLGSVHHIQRKRSREGFAEISGSGNNAEMQVCRLRHMAVANIVPSYGQGWKSLPHSNRDRRVIANVVELPILIGLARV